MKAIIHFPIFILLILFPTFSQAFDVNGDGREGLPEAIHALQVAVGQTPSKSQLIYVDSSGTPTENGNALYNMVESLKDAGTHENALYTIRLSPGIYDIGSRSLKLKDLVNIEGSGKWTTQITSSYSGVEGDEEAATLYFEDVLCELSNLTIWNSGSGYKSVALINKNGLLTMTNVIIGARGAIHENIGLFSNGGNTYLTNVEIQVYGDGVNKGVYGDFNIGEFFKVKVHSNGTGIELTGGRVEISSSDVSSTVGGGNAERQIGLSLKGDSVATIQGSIISGGNVGITISPGSSTQTAGSFIYGFNAIENEGSSSVKIATSKLYRNVPVAPGNTCVSCYDRDYKPLGADCQPLQP